jgi:hypothetical protein
VIYGFWRGGIGRVRESSYSNIELTGDPAGKSEVE